MGTLEKAKNVLTDNHLRSPEKGVEDLIYQAFLDSKKGKEFFTQKNRIEKKCSLKNVLVYFECFKYLEELGAIQNTHSSR